MQALIKESEDKDRALEDKAKIIEGIAIAMKDKDREIEGLRLRLRQK